MLLASIAGFCYISEMKDNLIKRRLDAIKELQRLKGDWKAIADASGVTYSWLCKFAQDKIPNPGVLTLHKLELALSVHRADA